MSNVSEIDDLLQALNDAGIPPLALWRMVTVHHPYPGVPRNELTQQQRMLVDDLIELLTRDWMRARRALVRAGHRRVADQYLPEMGPACSRLMQDDTAWRTLMRVAQGGTHVIQ